MRGNISVYVVEIMSTYPHYKGYGHQGSKEGKGRERKRNGWLSKKKRGERNRRNETLMNT